MAAEVFVDAGVWFAAANPKDRDHQASAGAMREAAAEGLRPVTTNLVVAEAHALLVHRVHRTAALAFLRRVRAAPLVLVTSTPEREDRAIREWIERYDDQAFSLTDAVSFTVMKERGIQDALALDRHVGVAGFRIRPGP
ncbi:MAG: type II toxin-antitoxin system VapC family toxin [Gemmatimonadetes bacterium]|nr:type II toxin-antitoxin system VapC family toxin [Gemmatimonadota bacterium]